MRQVEAARSGAEEDDRSSGEWSWSGTARTSQSSLQTLNEASQIPIKLNRQIPELEHPATLRKQRTANCSNRQRIQVCDTQNSRRRPLVSSLSLPSISNRELTMRRASASRVSSAMRGTCTALSNRELLELEIPQLAENKDRPPVLIANFEPKHFVDFQAFVAAAFRRAGPLLLGALEPAGQSGKSSQRSGCSK
jgi:hypothetical protein